MCCIIPVIHGDPSHTPRFLDSNPIPDLCYLWSVFISVSCTLSCHNHTACESESHCRVALRTAVFSTCLNHRAAPAIICSEINAFFYDPTPISMIGCGLPFIPIGTSALDITLWKVTSVTKGEHVPGNSSDGPDEYHGDKWSNSFALEPTEKENFWLYIHHANRLGLARPSIGPVDGTEPGREAYNLGLLGQWQVSGRTEMLMRSKGSVLGPRLKSWKASSESLI